MKPLIYTLAIGTAILLLGVALLLVSGFIRNRGISTFTTHVSSALLDLGMQTVKLPPDLNKTFLDECYAERRKMGRKADARALALDLFLRFFMAYSAQTTPNERLALIEHSIRTARQWQEKGNLEKASEDFLDTIEEIFIDEVAACDMLPVDRHETLRRVMSL